MTAPRRLKMWTGNLDGQRIGAVVAPSKARAMRIVGFGRKAFDDYWGQQDAVDPTLEPEQLYTRPIDRKVPWQTGICNLTPTTAVKWPGSPL